MRSGKNYHLPVIFLIILTAFVISPGCKQPQDMNAAAHPVHVDPFMAKRMEKEIVAARRSKDEYFKTDSGSPLPSYLKPLFTGLEYYPISWQYRFEGPVNRYPDPEKIQIITTSGDTRHAIRYGYIRFFLLGQEFKLQVYRLLDLQQDNLLFVPFIDANVGKETYPAGRYIDLVEKENGVYVIDFNTAYNPSCAYGGEYPCPVTPSENKLPIPIPAGEKILPIAPKKS